MTHVLAAIAGIVAGCLGTLACLHLAHRKQRGPRSMQPVDLRQARFIKRDDRPEPPLI